MRQPTLNLPIKIWEPEEEAMILTMREDGHTIDVIAKTLCRSLDRSFFAIRHRAFLLGKGAVAARPKPPAVVAKITRDIPKHELVDWYERGWRVESFSGDVVTIVYPHETEVTA
jgi:hypothetical protein